MFSCTNNSTYTPTFFNTKDFFFESVDDDDGGGVGVGVGVDADADVDLETILFDVRFFFLAGGESV